MPQIPDFPELIKAGVHFGHRMGKKHPQMTPYIVGLKNTVHIIDLEKTVEKLKEAMDFLKTTMSRGGTILFVGVKEQAKEICQKYAQECGMPYAAERWLGGTLTNFFVVHKLIEKYRNLKEQSASGELGKYTKKEQMLFQEEIKRLEKMVGGMEHLDKLPDALFLLDMKKADTAVREARRKKIPVVAICDADADPTLIAYPIPANDDAIQSIELITKLIAAAIQEGRVAQETAEKKEIKE